MLEKPESIALEGLGPVRSSKAARLKRIKPGYYNPPGGRPVFVPGMQWLTVMVAGMQGPPTLAAMRWWTSRGPLASHRREQTVHLLAQCAQKWQQRVIHVFDRGYAGAPWLTELSQRQLRFPDYSGSGAGPLDTTWSTPRAGVPPGRSPGANPPRTTG